jgi:hypothetical protein
MINIFKIKKLWIITLVMMLFSLISFAQDYSDKTIGFDIARVTTLLKEHGVLDRDLNWEIKKAREEFIVMHKNKLEILTEIQSRKASISANRSISTLNVISDVPQIEKDALLALYNSTNGNNWINKTGWDFSTPVTSGNSNNNTGWFGIAVDNGHIVYINLGSNGLTGSIPPEIGSLTGLTNLTLSWNSLGGEIPASLCNLPELKLVWLQTNNFSGTIPSNIGNLKKGEQFLISRNNLTGQIPASIQSMTQLNFLGIENNHLSKTIPDLSNLVNLSGFRLFNNNFYFADFANQFSYYKNKLSVFEYTPQGVTDTFKVITAGIGGTINLTMFEDNRFTLSDNFQWYKNGSIIPGAISRIYTISNVQASHAGSYYCISTNPEITNLTLTRNSIQLATTACIPLTGTINSTLEQFCTSKPSTFSFQTTNTNLTYKWSATTTANVVVNNVSNDRTGNYSYNFNIPGSYIIKAEITDALGCLTTFTKPITVTDCQETSCINQPIIVSFETASTNVTYKWHTEKDGSTQQLNPITNTTGSYTYTPTTPGKYTVFLEAYQSSECKFEFSKVIIVESCGPFISCTESNPNTATIKAIFTTLANKLVNLPATTITDGYTCDELKALAFYIKDENPAIYNFVHDTQQGFIAFSFSDHAAPYDIKIATNGNAIVNFNLDDYHSNEIVTRLTTTPISSVESYINHIDFCSGLYCVNHIALVLDESGSISLPEAAKIKKQLKKYIQQQADDNDKLQSNIYVSLTGMSDSDSVTRTDNITATRLTNTDPAVLKRFNNWIDNYRNRSGTGISPSSDYWETALDVALNSSMKPNVVMMITDGCETNDVQALRDQTMARFSNSKSTLFANADKPHLYVIGIADGFYVDGGITGGSLARSEDPNYVQTLTAATGESRVVPVLRTSLKYLLSFGETEYPTDKIDDFRYDFYGYENFDSLGAPENEYFISDNLKLSKFACGLPTDKNYCTDCLSFQPMPNKEYMLSAWVKEETAIQLKTYENAVINVVFFNNVDTNDIRHRIGIQICVAKGDIIDGWQRITSKFLIPEETKTIGIELENKSDGIPVYFDDIRIHPLDGSVKTFVYDAETFKLMSELDENNYSTFYEYDNEGGLIRIKKETAKGIKTIQETRSGNIINNN